MGAPPLLAVHDPNVRARPQCERGAIQLFAPRDAKPSAKFQSHST
jgi:hypothetical protein